MSSQQLADFLLERCKEQGLSLRRLSIKAGLSPATVHGIVTRKYQPTLFSLNQLADFLGVRREYLWYLANLLEDMDYSNTNDLSDPRLRFNFTRIDGLPHGARSLINGIIEAIIMLLDKGGKEREDDYSHGPARDNA